MESGTDCFFHFIFVVGKGCEYLTIELLCNVDIVSVNNSFCIDVILCFFLESWLPVVWGSNTALELIALNVIFTIQFLL